MRTMHGAALVGLFLAALPACRGDEQPRGLQPPPALEAEASGAPTVIGIAPPVYPSASASAEAWGPAGPRAKDVQGTWRFTDVSGAQERLRANLKQVPGVDEKRIEEEVKALADMAARSTLVITEAELITRAGDAVIAKERYTVVGESGDRVRIRLEGVGKEQVLTVVDAETLRTTDAELGTMTLRRFAAPAAPR